MGFVLKILQEPVVADIVKKVTSKLLGNRGVDKKVTAFAAPVAIFEIALQVIGALESTGIIPQGLSELLNSSKAAILEVAVLIGAIFAYFQPEE